MRIGTRGSALALAQARLVTGWLGGGEIVVVRTSGDRRQHEHANGGSRARRERPSDDDKSRWVAELEQALLAGKIDLAVHSAKDVPGQLPDGLELLGAPARASAEDALVGARSLEELEQGACVGTSSVRRAAQLRAARADLEVVSLRGNVDTRLRKLAHETGSAAGTETAGSAAPSARKGQRSDVDPHARDGQDEHAHPSSAPGEETSRNTGGERPLRAIVLASAGLWRLGRERDIGCTLDAARFVPAPGQGTLALQARTSDAAVRDAVEPILDNDASACLAAERAIAKALGASCNTPLGAYAAPAGCGCLNLRAWVGLPDGSEWIGDELLGGFYDPEELGRRVAERMDAVGARDLLARAEKMAAAQADCSHGDDRG
jgi:hydroxymethylbilane synthase